MDEFQPALHAEAFGGLWLWLRPPRPRASDTSYTGPRDDRRCERRKVLLPEPFGGGFQGTRAESALLIGHPFGGLLSRDEPLHAYGGEAS